MKKLMIGIMLAALLFVGGSGSAKTLVPLPFEVNLLPDAPNFKTGPFYNVSLNLGDMSFTTELMNKLVNGEKVFFINGGYTATNRWVLGAGVDMLGGLRALGVDVTTPVESFLLIWLGVKEFKVDLFMLYDPAYPLTWQNLNVGKNVITFGIGGTIYEFRAIK